MLRRVVAVGRIARRVVYFDDIPDQAGARGFLTIELGQTPHNTPLLTPTEGEKH